MNKSLDFVFKEQKELITLSRIAALLSWDQMTYMPAMGAIERSEQSALISRLVHERATSDKLWNHIQNLSKSETLNKLSEKDKPGVIRLKKDVEKARKVPPEFVKRMTKATTISYSVWEKARRKNNFSIFAPHLAKIIALKKEYCSFINLPGPRYNSLIDDYEEGMRVDILKKEFAYLKSKLSCLLEKVVSSEVYENQLNLNKTFSVGQQKKLCNIVIKKMNLPKNRSRLDVSTHPFTIALGYDDVRITTNFEHKDILFSFFSTIHETGHALYDLGLPKDVYKNTVISDSPSIGLHESQSRFLENMIAKGESFWKYFYPIFKKISSEQLKNIDNETWYKLINQVKPTLIRTEADELTYCLHIILRFEIELALIEDKIKVADLPHIWREKMQEMIGVTPENDKDGVLQDMHWSGGNFGYFPTYAIGTIYASQLFKKLSEENPNTQSEIEKGDFKNILTWLKEHVHKYGRLMTADEIIKNCCGEGLNSKIFLDYLKEKYGSLYQL